jgi:dipeptidyl aminopeptidase/acylaminoacyl peptidase
MYVVGADTVWRASVSANVPESAAIPAATVPGHQLVMIVSPFHRGFLASHDGGRSMLVLARDRVTQSEGVYRVDLKTGALRRLTEDAVHYGGNPTLMNFDVAADGGHIVFIREDAAHAPDIWISDAELRAPVRVTHANTAFDDYVMGKNQLISWRTGDGRTLYGALLLPSDYRAGQRYPLIVYPYAGANRSRAVGSFGLNLGGAGTENMQVFATRGYAVLLPDAPLPWRVSAPMKEIADLILPGVDRAIELGIADSTRLGVMGHSYGGYTTLSLIVQTTRFKAAVSRAGPGDLFAAFLALGLEGDAAGGNMFGAAWARGQGRMRGTPWERWDEYHDNSPIYYLDRVRTPLLVIQGTADNAVASHLADEVFVGLHELGREVEYARYASEGHGEPEWAYSNQLDYLTRLVAWFDTHLRR